VSAKKLHDKINLTLVVISVETYETHSGYIIKLANVS